MLWKKHLQIFQELWSFYDDIISDIIDPKIYTQSEQKNPPLKTNEGYMATSSFLMVGQKSLMKEQDRYYT